MAFAVTTIMIRPGIRDGSIDTTSDTTAKYVRNKRILAAAAVFDSLAFVALITLGAIGAAGGNTAFGRVFSVEQSKGAMIGCFTAAGTILIGDSVQLVMTHRKKKARTIENDGRLGNVSKEDRKARHQMANESPGETTQAWDGFDDGGDGDDW